MAPVQLKLQEVPNEVNWSFLGRWISAVKPQLFDHKGWAFSATAAVEAQIFNYTGSYYIISFVT